jgi:hypothetical protein
LWVPCVGPSRPLSTRAVSQIWWKKFVGIFSNPGK